MAVPTIAYTSGTIVNNYTIDYQGVDLALVTVTANITNTGGATVTSRGAVVLAQYWDSELSENHGYMSPTILETGSFGTGEFSVSCTVKRSSSSSMNVTFKATNADGTASFSGGTLNIPEPTPGDATDTGLPPQVKLNRLVGTVSLSKQECLNKMRNQNGSLSKQEMFNRLAETTGLSMQDAANAYVGTTGLSVQECIERM